MSVRGNYIATALNDEILVSDITTGRTLMRFEGDGEQVSQLALTPDCELLVVASRSFQILIFSLETQALVHTFAKAHESAILALSCDATSTLCASGGAEGATKVWDLRNLRLTHNLKGHGAPVSALAFFGKLGAADWRLASASEDGKLLVWDLVKSRVQHTLANHANTVTSLCWTSTGEALLSGGRDKIVSIWHGRALTSTIPVLDAVEDLGTISGHIYVLSPQRLRILALTAETVSEQSLDSTESEFVRVLSSENGQLRVLVSDQSINVYTVSEAGLLRAVSTLSTNHNEIIDLVSRGRDVVLATNSRDLRVVNLDANLLEFKCLAGHSDIVLAIDVLGNWVASGGKDGEARLWALDSLECKLVFKGHTGAVGAVALSRGGTDVPQFVLTGSQDLTIKRWDADGQAMYTRKAHDKDINTLDVAPSNSYFASGSQDRSIKIWDAASGDVVGLLKGHKRGVWSVRFVGNNTLVSGSADRCVRVWNLHDYTCTRTFEGHLSSVLKVLPYHDSVVSAGGDGLIKLWDTKTSECLSTLDGHEDKVWALTLDDRGQLVSGGGDGVLNVWEDCTEEEQIRIEKEEEEMLELQQDLDNSVRAQQWDKAIKIALKLNRPFRLLKLFTEVHESLEPGSITGLRAVDEVVQGLEGDELCTFLERVRDWNTSGKTSILAQTLLRAVLLAPDSNEKLMNPRTLKILAAITPYTERHLARAVDMLEVSYSLDYILKQMTL